MPRYFVQAVLLSTSSIGILSSVVAISVTSKRRWRPRSPRPSPPLHLRTAATKQLPARVGKHTFKTHSSRIERRPARGGGAEQRHASSRGSLVESERERERSRSGGAALKNTGSRRRAHRSASTARGASRQCASCQLQPAAAPDLGRYLRHLKQLGPCQSFS